MRFCQGPLFENLVGGSTSPPLLLQQKGGLGGAHYKYTSCFATRAILFVLIINLCNSQPNTCTALADMLRKIHIRHQASEAPGLIKKKIKNLLERSKFIGMWGTDNRLIVSSCKNYKIPENSWYLKALVNTMST